MNGRKTIAVDIDDVLASSTKSWVDFSNKTWGTRLTIDDYDEDWAKMWSVDKEEGHRRAHIIYDSGIVKTFAAHEGALGVLRELQKHYKLVITTSRVKYTYEDTLSWLEENFSDIFDEIHLAGFYDSDHEDPISMTKADLVKAIGADYPIDDHPKHCIAAAKVGIPSLLFGDYSWSRGSELPDTVTRVGDWQEVLEYFDGQAGR